MDSVEVERNRSRARDAAAHLSELLVPGCEFERLIDGYVETKNTLAQALRVISQHELGDSETVLSNVKDLLVERMRERFKDAVPETYLHASAYRSIHGVLLTYLARHIGNPVSASRLRVLTGDQVHTERRVRELRDLGLRVDVSRAGGENQYILRDLEPDLDAGASIVVGHNISDDRRLSATRKAELLAIVGREPGG